VTKKNANTSTSKEFGYQYPSLDILVYTPPVLVAELGGGHVKDGDRISLEGNGEFIGIQKSTVLMWYINNIFLLANYAEVGLRIKLADGMEVGDKITCKVKVTNKWGSIEVPAEGFYTIMP
jgi:hypothetical protein